MGSFRIVSYVANVARSDTIYVRAAGNKQTRDRLSLVNYNACDLANIVGYMR